MRACKRIDETEQRMEMEDSYRSWYDLGEPVERAKKATAVTKRATLSRKDARDTRSQANTAYVPSLRLEASISRKDSEFKKMVE